MQLLLIFGVTFGALLLVISGMAVGVILGRKPISGSCGGLNSTTNEDGSSACSLCSQPSDGCRDLREKMAQSGSRLQTEENSTQANAICEKDCEEEGCTKETINACKGH